MKPTIVSEQLANKLIVRSQETDRAERTLIIKALRDAEADCAKAEAEAQEANKALEAAQKQWESARGICGSIATKRASAGVRYQRAMRRLDKINDGADSATADELFDIAVEMRAFSEGGNGSDETRKRLKNAADLIDSFLVTIRPMVSDIEAAIALVNEAFDTDDSLQSLQAEQQAGVH